MYITNGQIHLKKFGSLNDLILTHGIDHGDQIWLQLDIKHVVILDIKSETITIFNERTDKETPLKESNDLLNKLEEIYESDQDRFRNLQASEKKAAF